MALQEQAISIPILPMNQKSSEISGPVGRLKRLVNGVVDKYDPDGQWLRIVKRPAFRSLTRMIGDPDNGGHLTAAGVPTPSVADNLRNQLFTVGSDTTPYVYSAASVAWQKFVTETILTNKLSYSSIWAQSTQIQCPDAATAGSTHCYVWQQGGNCWALILDDDGTVIRSAFQVGTGGRVKVVSDTTRFFVFVDQGSTTVTVIGFTQTGVPIPSTTAATLHAASDTWDVTFQNDAIGVALVHRGVADGSTNSGATLVFVTVSGSTITATPVYASTVTWGHTDGGDDMGGVIFTNNGVADKIFVAVPIVHVDFTTDYTLSVYEIDNTGTVAHTYQPIVASPVPGLGIINMAGYVDSNATVHALVSHLPYTGATPAGGFAANTLTEFGHATTGTDNQGYKVVRSVGLASRVTFVSGVPVVYTYYASVPSFSELGFVEVGQPTFFLLRADTGDVVGRILHANAAEDWIWTSWNGTSMPPPNGFQLPTPRETSAGIAVLLGRAGAQQAGVGTGSGGIVQVDNFISTVGVTDVTLATVPGTCVELDQETLIPGPLPRSFDGVSFSASGIELGPEIPFVEDSGTAGGLNAGETYGYVIVYERTDRSGRKIRSASSINQQYIVTSGSNRSAELTIPTLRVTTHDDIIISVYRTVWADGQQGTTHRKVTNDLDPVMNDPTVDAVTFTDSATNAAAAVGEPLYGGEGAVPAAEGGGDGQEVNHDPPPPFSAGCVFQDRAFVIGPDGSVSFSLPGSASSPFVFNEDEFSMTVPSVDKAVALAALDARLVFLCQSSFWFVNSDSFLDATGAGDIPTPQQLPITHGCTGVAAVIPDGVIYEASSGGFYLLGRDLTSTYIGAAIEDELVGATIKSVATDQSQRVYFLTSSNKILVYDLVFKGWYIFEPPSMAEILSVWKGQLVYSDGSDVFILTPGEVADNPGGVDQPITTTIEFEPMSFADVQMFWDLDLFVSGGLDYGITATVCYDLDTSEPDVFPTFNAAAMDVDGSGHARFNLPITQPECTYLSLTLNDTFPDGPSAGFVLEKMVAAVGVVPGKRRNNLNQRVQA